MNENIAKTMLTKLIDNSVKKMLASDTDGQLTETFNSQGCSIVITYDADKNMGFSFGFGKIDHCEHKFNF